MSNYYAQSLNAARLAMVYETEIPRIRQYLAAEIDHVRRALGSGDRVLEVGAGYGRILKELAPHAATLVGIDISPDNVAYGTDYLADCPNASLQVMDAHAIRFDEGFDAVLCLQNGLSAMKGEPEKLVTLCLNATVPGGRVFFSTYSPRFWEQRLDWFREQAGKGLVGEIDEERTRNGVIICKDGFTARSFTEDDLRVLGKASGRPFTLEEIDGSSLFLVLTA